MNEVGIDMSGQRPKRIADVPLGDVDTVVTLCAEEVCAGLPGSVHTVAWGFPDPAATPGGEGEIDAAFRQVRDELKWRIEGLLNVREQTGLRAPT
jgi:arsenate reductase